MIKIMVVCSLAIVFASCGCSKEYSCVKKGDSFCGFNFGSPAPKSLQPDEKGEYHEVVFLKAPYKMFEVATVGYTKATKVLASLSFVASVGQGYLGTDDDEEEFSEKRKKALAIANDLKADVEEKLGIEIEASESASRSKHVVFYHTKDVVDYEAFIDLQPNGRLELSIFNHRVYAYNARVFKAQHMQK